MLRLLLLAATFLAFATEVLSQPKADKNSAGWMLPYCQETTNQEPLKIIADQYLRGFCSGLVTGISAFVPDVCPPSRVTTLDQLQKVVVAYIEARPARHHESFTLLATEALQEAWPCKK